MANSPLSAPPLLAAPEVLQLAAAAIYTCKDLEFHVT